MPIFNKKSNRSRSDPSTPSSSKRQATKARDTWEDYFQLALEHLMSTDNDRVKELSEDEARVLVESAARVAEKALEKIEERFEGAG